MKIAVEHWCHCYRTTVALWFVQQLPCGFRQQWFVQWTHMVIDGAGCAIARTLMVAWLTRSVWTHNRWKPRADLVEVRMGRCLAGVPESRCM